MNQDQIKQLNEAVEAVKTRKIENVYFVACGGSKAIFDPAQFIFDRETTLPSFVYNANEFIHRCPKGLGENSLVVTCSHSGNTLEPTRATQLLPRGFPAVEGDPASDFLRLGPRVQSGRQQQRHALPPCVLHPERAAAQREV